MQEIEESLTKNAWYSDYNKLDKFGVGPWLNEPDYVTWVDEETGYHCIIRRNPEIGILCGYVGVDGKHPLHGKDKYDFEIECHGGLTYSDSCDSGIPKSFWSEYPICHKADSNDEAWWFGFDCGHGFDLSPSYNSSELLKNIYEIKKYTYKDINYVKDQCKSLAKQLKDYKS